MPLTRAQTAALRRAIQDYAFPAGYFDFTVNAPVRGLGMAQVETRIRSALTSGDPGRVKDGLSNVLYWGYAQMGGLANVRVAHFRARVTSSQLRAAADLFSRSTRPTLKDIARLRMPQFSGVSFVSKVRMFLDPGRSATLDNQIMKIHGVQAGTVLAGVKRSGATMRVTAANAAAYEAWCQRLNAIRRTYGLGRRVVDIERGLFHLIQRGRTAAAANLLARA